MQRLQRWPGWARPSLGDLFLISLGVWLFAIGSGWMALLADGDIGWHIRTGQWILDTRSVPRSDLFSFSRSGASWFAWEWLSDVIFALLCRAWGLAGVVVLAACVIVLAAWAVFRHMLWRGSQRAGGARRRAGVGGGVFDPLPGAAARVHAAAAGRLAVDAWSATGAGPVRPSGC